METNAVTDSGDNLSKRSDKEGEKLKHKSKKEDGADHSARKKQDSEKNKNNNEVNDNSSSNAAEDRNTLINYYDRGTEQCAAANGETIEIKSLTQQEEKSTNKKKIHNEDANGRGKEECEKKKRKKKKKKKGGSCEDESSKPGRDGEPSKDRLKVKNGVSKNGHKSKDTLKNEQRTEIIEQTPGNTEKIVSSVTIKDETPNAIVEENAIATCNKDIQNVPVAVEEANVTEVKTSAEDATSDCLIDAQAGLDRSATAEVHNEKGAAVESSQANVSEKEELLTMMLTEMPTEIPTEIPTKMSTEMPTELPTKMSTDMPTELPTEMRNLPEIIKLENYEMANKATITIEAASSDHHDIVDEDSVKVTFLHTIIESDEAVVMVKEVLAKDITGEVLVKDFTDQACSIAKLDVNVDVDKDIDNVDSGETYGDRAVSMYVLCNV